LKLPRKTQYPTKIRVHKAEYSIAFVDQIEGRSTLGLCDFERKIIFIRNRQKSKDTLKTFIHELLHAIEHEFDLTMQHDLIYKLEDPIFQVLYDNIIGDMFKAKT
jgi:hypothetical protein